MGHIIYNNLISGATFSKTDLSGTVTESTDINNLGTRSPLLNYVVTGGGLGDTYRLVINLSSSVTSKSIAFLGYNTVSITPVLWTGGFGSTQVTYNATTITKTRYIDGVEYTDKLYIFDDDETFDTITVESTIDLGTETIGSVYVADDILDIDFDPKKCRISPTNTGYKDRSNGGQVYSTSGITYDSINVSSTPQVIATALTGVRTINNEVGTTEPCFLVVEQSDNMFFYGTQSKPAQTMSVEKSNGAMLWMNNFSFEEEL